jgi:exonuclease III
MIQLAHNYKMMSWNVTGMNNLVRQEEIKQHISTIRPEVICIQETKMATINSSVIRNALGLNYENNFTYLPAVDTRGGILIIARESIIQIQNPVLTNHTISATIRDTRHNLLWSVTRVYGPQGTLDKNMFIIELKNLKQTIM